MVFLVICINSLYIFFQMQYKILKELLLCKVGDVVLYLIIMVKVCVIKVGYIVIFNSLNGEEGQMLNFSVVDVIEVMMVILSDEIKFN